MCVLMYRHLTLVSKCFITHITCKWMLCNVCALMRLHITQVTGHFLHITCIWMFSIMCVLMCLHVTHVTECFVTYITSIWLKLNYVCADVSSCYACNEMLYHIHYRYMDSPLYACVRVSLCYACNEMLYHKHNRYMDSPL
jgi:hypothetical protein